MLQKYFVQLNIMAKKIIKKPSPTRKKVAKLVLRKKGRREPVIAVIPKNKLIQPRMKLRDRNETKSQYEKNKSYEEGLNFWLN